MASFESRHLDDENEDDDDDESDATMESRFSRCPGRFYIQRPEQGNVLFRGARKRDRERRNERRKEEAKGRDETLCEGPL